MTETVTFRRTGIGQYAIMLDGRVIGEVVKVRSVDLLTGAVRRPVWTAQTEARHPFGVTTSIARRGASRQEAAGKAVDEYRRLCSTTVVELCAIDRQGREAGWW
ncbi:hypothetical protein B7435_30155 [Mycolicibacterium peregrinum]|uniref:hypothetical protein n=1 Tax=Mycolicibacterium peregrinum TaxID=43304 RepID=UPI000B4C0F10|nr:hypothetical protein [Mycolicibacterium peregrinum]OWL95551.1 hypothetical protein B7435_30155 [Mycolicibacterium peregrinum]